MHDRTFYDLSIAMATSPSTKEANSFMVKVARSQVGHDEDGECSPSNGKARMARHSSPIVMDRQPKKKWSM